MFEKLLARASQARITCGAHKELGTQVFFEFFYRPRQRRLLNVQSFGCASKMEFFGYRQKTT